ncbi:alpha/beta hydrolase [Marinactinospora rubrisoli]|uniref:Alpha/beta hydrolase n=1 Tax=Marinactinospora rubrisoli TaxID=2715399 RepID=A0ABW2KDA3_9ACTN
MEYAIDPELRAWLDLMPRVDITDIAALRRAEEAAAAELSRYEPVIPVHHRDVPIPGPGGAPPVRARIYTPVDRADELPGLLYLHGGGFVLGSVDGFHPEASRVAGELGAVVVSVDYRLAPEHPFPAGVADCFAALTWAAEHAGELGIDPTRLGVGGESAGGGLAAAVALLARDRGGPEPCFQYLGIPELDDRLDTPSMRDFVDTPLWDRRSAELSWDYYLGPGVRGGAGVSPYAAPARAADLSGLPPACVTACQYDPLRDEGLEYARRLIQAGVPTELFHYPGTFHGSTLVTEAAVSKRMVADKMGALRRGLRAGEDEPVR